MRETGDLFHPTDPEFLQNPYPTYARLRREAPIAYFPGWNAFLITRHRDVDALLRDRRLGRVMHHLQAPSERPAPNPDHAPFDAIQAGSLLEIEPPDHTRIKQVVHEVFTPKHVRALSGRIEALVERLLDGLEASREPGFNLIGDFAEVIPVTVIAELLGVPEGERARLLPWSKAIIGMFEPERSAAMERAAVQAAAEFAGFVRELLQHKRQHPGDDLLTRMLREHDADPERLSESEIVANAILFLNAGHEAVVNVSGNGMLALLQRPEAGERLRAEPALWPSAVEEMMRFDTPLQFFERRVLEPMDYGGVHWPFGTKLVLYFGSANRDEEVFTEPDRFDVARSPNPHVAFGLGVHYCIGAPLARLELTTALPALLRRFPGLTLEPREHRFQPKNVFRYLDALPVLKRA